VNALEVRAVIQDILGAHYVMAHPQQQGCVVEMRQGGDDWAKAALAGC